MLVLILRQLLAWPETSPPGRPLDYERVTDVRSPAGGERRPAKDPRVPSIERYHRHVLETPCMRALDEGSNPFVYIYMLGFQSPNHPPQGFQGPPYRASGPRLRTVPYKTIVGCRVRVGDSVSLGVNVSASVGLSVKPTKIYRDFGFRLRFECCVRFVALWPPPPPSFSPATVPARRPTAENRPRPRP